MSPLPEVEGLLDSVRALPVFRGLDDARITAMLSGLVWKRLRGGEVLCRAGAPGDRAWILVSGRLKVYAPTPDGDTYRNTLGPGAFLGTVALLRGGTRTATVVASRDVALLEVSEAAFFDMLQREPGVARRVLGGMTEQLLRRRGPRVGEEVRVVTLLPLEDPRDVVALAHTLRSACREIADAAVLTAADVEEALGEGASCARADDALDAKVTEWLSRREQAHDVLFLVADVADNAWTRRCVRHADRVLSVADALAGPHLRPVEGALADSGSRMEGATGLLLLHPPYAIRGRDTAAWLAKRPNAAVFHLRRARAEDAGRVARNLLRRGVGVALGGGGCRGLGHVGLVGAFSDQGVPIDAVSGTSAGAAVAGLVGMQRDYDQIVKAVGALLSSTRGHARNLGPPVVSLMSGQHVHRLLDDMFGDAHLEDLFVPTRVVSVDLRRAETVTLSRGPVWQAVRASASLPIIWPPVLLDERVLVDGGLRDNLPARALLPQARHGAIVASQVFAYRGGRMPMHYDQAVLSGWRALRQVVRKEARLPNFAEIMMRAMMQGSKLSDEETVRRYVDLLLQPDVGRIGMFAVRTLAETIRISAKARQDVRDKISGWDWTALARVREEAA